MYNRVLATNGGPHSPEDWARVTCEDLIPVDGLVSELTASGMILRGRLMDVLAEHYKQVQDEESAALRNRMSRFDEELEGVLDFGQLFAEIQAAANGTPWQGHITGADVIDAIRAVVTDHARHMRHVERLWHADRNPGAGEGQLYRKRHGLPPTPEAVLEPAPPTEEQ